MNFVPPEGLKTLSDEEITMQLRWRRSTLHFIETPETATSFLRARGVSPESTDLKIFCAWQRRWLKQAAEVAKERGINADELELLTMEEWENLNSHGGKRYTYEEVILRGIKPEERPAWLLKLTNFLMEKLEKPQQYPLWIEFFGPNKERLISFKFDSVEDMRGEIAICLGRLRSLEAGT